MPDLWGSYSGWLGAKSANGIYYSHILIAQSHKAMTELNFWDAVFLEHCRQGMTVHTATTSANQALEARRAADIYQLGTAPNLDRLDG